MTSELRYRTEFFCNAAVSYEPLHHKYRPQTFAELVGQEAIAQTLSNALRSQKIAPAYLFTGSRGTGKTSSARILAKSLNCLSSPHPTETPCGKCDVCVGITKGSTLDVIEIDAASNTGVDNIRELIERAQFAPVQCRYKVYVLDEVHMLTGQAFNCLLKTLEEPPNRVVFVLATTDPQRVLATIISRCQRFDFRRIPLDAMVMHLRYIAGQEKIEITTDACTLIAQVAQGGLRDAESLLDQLSLLSGQVTVERVWDLVGAVPERDLLALLKAIASNSPEAVLETAQHLMDRGREPLIVLQNLAGFYRDILIAKTAPSRSDLVAVTPPTWEQLCNFQGLDIGTILQGQKHLKDSEVQIKNTTQPRLWLEVTLLGLLPSANVSQPRVEAIQPSFNSSNGATSSNYQPTPTNNGAISSDRPNNGTTSSNYQPNPTNNGVKPSSDRPNPTPTTESASTPTHEPIDTSDTQKIWEQLLENVSIGSKALFKEHAYLTDFNGQQAKIGLRSPKLMKMAQSKLPDVEAAFQRLFKTKIKVSLGVVGETSAKLQKPEPSQPESFTPIEPPQPPRPSLEPVSRTLALPEPEAVTSITQAIEPSELEAIGESLAPEAIGQSPSPEAIAAAQSFAKFFSGDIIDFGDEVGSANLTTATISHSSSQAIGKSPAPEAIAEVPDDDDLPF